MTKILFPFIATIVLLSSCNEQIKQVGDVNTNPSAVVVELTDEDYPDNPDISIRHNLDGTFSHDKCEIIEKENSFDLIFYPNNKHSDTLVLGDIDLMEWMPTIPEYIRMDEYLSLVGIINQEWNRQQVKLFEDKFRFSGSNQESKITKRVDLARNCLNAYLWEVIAYAEEDSSLKPVYHGWFNFPEGLYARLFKLRNGVDFDRYKEFLVNWKDIESKTIDLSVLRDLQSEVELEFENLNASYYPLVGERGKKNKNVVSPKAVVKIQDYLNDSTRFGTFTPPGFYNTSDPRVTYLSMLSNLESVKYADVISKTSQKDTCIELRLKFNDGKGIKTDLLIGGIDKAKIPVLDPEMVHKGYQMPMGIANHSFYETYKTNQARKALDIPYYGFLLDEEGKWIDSHKIGIDGPMLHFDEEGYLHFWILSFERHAFVGHYKLQM